MGETEDPLGHRPGDQKATGPARRRDHTKIAELFADERCSQAILDFLATADVGRTLGPPVAEQRLAKGSREREERLAALRKEEERLGMEE